ncbi:MAG: metal ABC transporter permease [Planctomycetes bacterium]|nr:metal ABC transporter permease [Planctomycetota bacterium]
MTSLFPPSYGYLAAPLVACVFITGLLTYLGAHVLQRGILFVDLALAQIAALGTTYAFYLGYDPMSREAYFCALGFTTLGAGLFALTRRREPRVPQEAIIGISYAVASGAAVLLVDLAQDPHGSEKIQHLLVGNLVWITWPEVWRTAGICLAVGVIHLLFRRRFLLVTFHPAEAEAGGLSLRTWDFLFYLSFGAAITGIVRIAGVLLVFSYLIIPATIGMLYSDRVRGRLVIGWAVGLSVSFFGLLLSYERPGGPMIVTLFGLCLIAFGAIRYVATAASRGRAAATLAGLGGAVLLVLLAAPLLPGHREAQAPHENEPHGNGHGPADVRGAEDRLSDHAGRPHPTTSETGIAARLLEALQSADENEREKAIDRLAERGDDAALEALSEALANEKDEGLRLKLAGLLAERGRSAGLQALVILLSEAQFPFVRSEALERLRAAAGESFGYDPVQSPAENAEALVRWRAWLGGRADTPPAATGAR